MDQAQLSALSYRAQQREEWLGSIAERLRSADFQLRRSTGERLFLDELVRALDNGRDMLILGNTGSGKSWLLLKLLQQVTRSSIVVRDSRDGDSEAQAALTGRPAEVIGYTNKTVESSMIGNFGLIALEDFTVAPQLVGQLRSQKHFGSRVGLLATSQEALNRSQGIAESLGLRAPITVGLSFRMDRGFFSGRVKHSYLGTVYGL